MALSSNELSSERRGYPRGPQEFTQASFWVPPREVDVLFRLESEAVWEEIDRRIREGSTFDYEDDTIAVLAACLTDVRGLRRKRRRGASFWANWVAGGIRQRAQLIPDLDKGRLFISVSRVVTSLISPNENFEIGSRIPYLTATTALERLFDKRNWRKLCSTISEPKTNENP